MHRPEFQQLERPAVLGRSRSWKNSIGPRESSLMASAIKAEERRQHDQTDDGRGDADQPRDLLRRAVIAEPLASDQRARRQRFDRHASCQRARRTPARLRPPRRARAIRAAVRAAAVRADLAARRRCGRDADFVDDSREPIEPSEPARHGPCDGGSLSTTPAEHVTRGRETTRAPRSIREASGPLPRIRTRDATIRLAMPELDGQPHERDEARPRAAPRAAK